MKPRQLLTILAVVVTLVINYLSNALPINGYTPAQISDSFPVLFVPAGYVFSIWGIIYMFMLGFTVYQALPSQRDNPRIAAITPWFIATCVFNSTWIFMWHYLLFPLSIVMMLGLLVSLVAIYLKLDIGRQSRSLAETLLVNTLFSIYLGWITVATIANLQDVLYNFGYRGEPIGPVAWAVLLIVVAAGIGMVMTVLRREIAYPLVLVWALYGIAVKQAADPVVATTATVAAAAVGLLLAADLVRRIFSRQGKASLSRA